MNANEVIANAYYLSDIVSRELETVSGSQQAAGLRMLNALLAQKSIKGWDIPYYTHSSLNTVKGQESYFVSSLIIADAVTYNIADIRYSMLRSKRKEYFGSSRADNIESLPGSFHVERCVGGANIYFYALPADVYEVKITGKFALPSVTGAQEMSPPTMDAFYADYLEYALAERLCNFYNIEFAPAKLKVLSQYENDIFQVSPPDLQIKKASIFRDGRYDNYNPAYSGLYRGFLPP